MKIVIVDDELSARKTLRLLLAHISGEYEIIEEFDSVKSAVEMIPSLSFDLLLLDVELLDGTGFDILSQLPNLRVNVVFTTAYENYAVKALRQNAVDYLLKPIDLEELKVAINRCTSKKDKALNYDELLHQIKKDLGVDRIALQGVGQMDFISVKDIVSVTSDGSYAIINMMSGAKYTSSKALKHYEQLLCASKFIRINRSELINYNLISQFKRQVGHGLVVMENGDQLGVSRRRKLEFCRVLARLSKENTI